MPHVCARPPSGWTGVFVYLDWQVIVDDDRRVQARGEGRAQEEQAAGVLQVEHGRILPGTQDADACDAALRVIGDCDGAAFVQIVGQG